MKKYIVVTTINSKSDAIKKLERIGGWNIVIVGDKKSKKIDSTDNLIFLSIDDQQKLEFDFVKTCPYNHYARKNIGYLYAIQQGADVIYETDDDNIPNSSWGILDFKCSNECRSKNKFINIYKYFSENFIWPRGFPLDQIQGNNFEVKKSPFQKVGIWQGLVDNEPDVDAIFRLLFKQNIKFNEKEPIFIRKNNYCPFNSQNTFWNKKIFAGLYLPTTVSFRFTDILRSYIAQRLMWQQNLCLGFIKPSVHHDRNLHNSIKDFKNEIECYLNVKPVTKLLDSIKITGDIFEDLNLIYKNLEESGLVELKELDSCRAWINDLKQINSFSF